MTKGRNVGSSFVNLPLWSKTPTSCLRWWMRLVLCLKQRNEDSKTVEVVSFKNGINHQRLIHTKTWHANRTGVGNKILMTHHPDGRIIHNPTNITRGESLSSTHGCHPTLGYPLAFANDLSLV